jgi:hypothetical protein
MIDMVIHPCHPLVWVVVDKAERLVNPGFLANSVLFGCIDGNMLAESGFEALFDVS